MPREHVPKVCLIQWVEHISGGAFLYTFDLLHNIYNIPQSKYPVLQ